MKQFFILSIIFLFVFVSGINGKVQKSGFKLEIHTKDFPLQASIYGNQLRTQLQKDENGTIQFETNTPLKGFCNVYFGPYPVSLYIEPGANLNIKVDYQKLKAFKSKAIDVAGTNSNEIVLLYRLKLNKEKNKYSDAEIKEIYYPKVFGKKPEDFLKYQMNELNEAGLLIDEYVERSTKVNKDFVKELRIKLLLEYNREIQKYEGTRRGLSVEQVEVPDEFKNYLADLIPQDDMELFRENSLYANYVMNQYHVIMSEALAAQKYGTLEYYKACAAFLETCNFPELVMQKIYGDLIFSYMRERNPDVKAYLEKMISENVKDEAALKRFQEAKAPKVALTNDGKMAPLFTLIDRNGKEVSLLDFKGKMVMMDCWATWCGPCVKGLPKYKELKEKYEGKDIVFLTVSTDSDPDSWKKKMAKDTKDLFEGIQLNTSLNQNDFKEKYQISAIPRYILIGKDGKIISYHAPHPASPQIIDLINNNLKSKGISFGKSTFKEALSKAKKEDKLVFMDCYTSWCGPCKKMSNEIFTQKKVGDFFNSHFVNIKVDMEKGEGKELAKQLGVYNFPTLLFIDANGKELHRYVGSCEAEKLIAQAKIAFDPGKQISALQARYENGDRVVSFLYDYAQALLAANNKTKLLSIGQEVLKTTPKNELLNAKVIEVIKLSKALEYDTESYRYIVDNKEKFIAVEGISQEDYDGIIGACIHGYLFSIIDKSTLDELKAEIAKVKNDFVFPQQQMIENEVLMSYYTFHEEYNNWCEIRLDQAEIMRGSNDEVWLYLLYQ